MNINWTNMGGSGLKKVLIAFAAALAAGLLCLHIPAHAAKATQGKEGFVKNCAICHANGENTINPAKTIHRKNLELNGVKKPADIVEKMRHPGPGMTQFDEKTIPDKEAKAIAEYILKTFK